jgi:predicted transposase/invertase (TIGR01784 family)
MEDSLKYYRDLKNSLDTAKEERKEEGRIEGRIEGKIEGIIERDFEIAKVMLKSGESLEKIIRYTGLTLEQINKIKENEE